MSILSNVHRNKSQREDMGILFYLSPPYSQEADSQNLEFASFCLVWLANKFQQYFPFCLPISSTRVTGTYGSDKLINVETWNPIFYLFNKYL